MRILYVEDNLANLSLVQRLARVGDHEVISHPDGEAALANIDQDKPDLILMDVQLKGALTGLEVVKALRARGHKTPIIALTAYAMVGDRERCLQAGCDDYLPKPLPVEQLVEFFQRYDPQKVTIPTPPSPNAVETQSSSTPPISPAQPVTAAQETAAEIKPADASLAAASDHNPASPDTSSPPNTTSDSMTASDGATLISPAKEAGAAATTQPAPDDVKQPTAPLAQDEVKPLANTNENAVNPESPGQPAGSDSSGISG